MIQAALIPASHGELLPMFCATLVMVSTKPEDDISRPNRPFNWEATIITEVADVNPTVTGIDMKSMRTSARVARGNEREITIYLASNVFFLEKRMS